MNSRPVLAAIEMDDIVIIGIEIRATTSPRTSRSFATNVMSRSTVA